MSISDIFIKIFYFYKNRKWLTWAVGATCATSFQYCSNSNNFVDIPYSCNDFTIEQIWRQNFQQQHMLFRLAMLAYSKKSLINFTRNVLIKFLKTSLFKSNKSKYLSFSKYIPSLAIPTSVSSYAKYKLPCRT